MRPKIVCGESPGVEVGGGCLFCWSLIERAVVASIIALRSEPPHAWPNALVVVIKVSQWLVERIVLSWKGDHSQDCNLMLLGDRTL